MIFIESQNEGWVNLNNVIEIRPVSIVTDNWHGVQLIAHGVSGNEIILIDIRDLNDTSPECQTTPEYENDILLNAINAVTKELMRQAAFISNAVYQHTDIMQMVMDAEKDQEIHT